MLDHRHLAPPMKRRISNASSSTTDTSSTSAASDISCTVVGCGATFSGKYQKGNLARHIKRFHNSCDVYECENSLCGAVFWRPDARLKHYRKRHPNLAADKPYIPRGRQPRSARSPQPDQELDLSNVWTGDPPLSTPTARFLYD